MKFMDSFMRVRRGFVFANAADAVSFMDRLPWKNCVREVRANYQIGEDRGMVLVAVELSIADDKLFHHYFESMDLSKRVEAVLEGNSLHMKKRVEAE